jgi:NAD(P)-dependent dehydrogenase (short-subunit alcohol dehydrogenase family)
MSTAPPLPTPSAPLEGRRALVTGAGHRLGRAIALALAGAGADIVVHYRSSQKEAEDTAARVRSLGRDAELLRADLAHPDEVARLFERVVAGGRGLDVLVNSAASFEGAPFSEIDAAAWDAVMAVNLRAPFLCTRHAAPLLEASSPGPGAVVNIADLSGLVPWRGFTHHSVSKAGLLHLTRAAAKELGPAIRVNAVVPGPILPPPGEDEDGEAWRRRGDRLPLKRTGQPEHVGAAVVFLAANDYITGEAIAVDGGEHLLTGR